TGAVSTQYNMKLLEEVGLVKMDFLGLKTLTLIKHSQELIRKKVPDFSIEAVSEEDRKTFDLLGDGKSNCVFQFESPGMQAILKRAKPSRIEDLIALNALYRPGPMQNIDQYIDCKNGKKRITYPLPQLESVLKETYGVIIYQEQVMEIARVVGGYSLGKADVLRRAMGKKLKEDLPQLKKEFIDGALKQNIPRNKAEEIFDLLIPFADYGFNKSHAAAYSILAYQTAYLKANHPAEFMAANLTNEIGQPDKLAKYMAESRSMGLTILPPDINISEKYFTVVQGNIVYGLYGIKNVGTAAVDEIIRVRSEEGPYNSLKGFLEKVDLKTINKKVLESLIQAGLFDKIESDHSRATLFANLERLVEFVARQKENSRYGQASLFGREEDTMFTGFSYEDCEDWPSAQILKIEKELLGFYFSGHPLDSYREIWQKTVTIDLDNPDKAVPGKPYTLLGIMRNIQFKTTKNGKQMAFGQIEDYNGSMELVFFPDTWERCNYLIKDDALIAVTGKFNTERERLSFIVEEVKRPEDIKIANQTEIHIRISGSLEDEDELYQLRAFLVDHSGASPVYIHLKDSLPEEEAVIKASSQISIMPADAVLNELRNIPFVEEVWRS
ncbi:MAG: DNA polymerase III subunit alpha, partial [Spirochaetales bacterium]